MPSDEEICRAAFFKKSAIFNIFWNETVCFCIYIRQNDLGMKKSLLFLITILFSSAALNAQETMAEDIRSWAGQWQHAFSKEGVKSWKPEFTLRATATFGSMGPILSGGARIDEKRTLGLMLGYGDTYIDAAPGHTYSINAGLFLRRYFHLGPKRILSFYSDLYVGGGYIYKIEGKEIRVDPSTGHTWETIDESVGDILPIAGWQPGIRVRIIHNVHIFIGPTIATNRVGFHLGFGF